MSRKAAARRGFSETRANLRAYAGALYKQRRKLPREARSFVSTMIEQIYQIEDEADLVRLAPYMRYERRRLEETLQSLNQQPRGNDG